MGAGLMFPIAAAAAASIDAQPASAASSVEVFDVVNLFGRMANPTCFGSIAKHASCQIDTKSLGVQLFSDAASSSSAISKEDLKNRVNEMAFEWPLKPYGTEDQRAKTVTLNKPAELSEWKTQAKRKNLGDLFYLNGSDRDRVNSALAKDPVSDQAIDNLFKALSKDGKSVGKEDIALLSGMDWFEFSSLIFNQ